MLVLFLLWPQCVCVVRGQAGDVHAGSLGWGPTLSPVTTGGPGAGLASCGDAGLSVHQAGGCGAAAVPSA